MTVVSLVLFGALGALMRAWVDELLADSRPWATAVVNIVGSAILGLTVGGTDWLTTTIGVGFCGALTTFSSYSLHVVRLIREQRVAVAMLFVGVSTLGALAGYVGAVSLV